jgi:RNA polymerase sigma-70 factor (ECF subfamily)
MSTPESSARTPEVRLREGDRSALAELLAEQEGALRRWVEHRLDPRLQGRLSSSDVLQEIYLAAEQRLENFRSVGDMPFQVWIRLLADQRLVEVHRKHFGAHARDVRREVALERIDGASNVADLATRLASDLTSPSQAAVRVELIQLLANAVESLEPLDREILALRHFEELSNEEVARLLEIPKGTASKRYVRALARLKTVLEKIPGLLDDVL